MRNMFIRRFVPQNPCPVASGWGNTPLQEEAPLHSEHELPSQEKKGESIAEMGISSDTHRVIQDQTKC